MMRMLVQDVYSPDSSTPRLILNSAPTTTSKNVRACGQLIFIAALSSIPSNFYCPITMHEYLAVRSFATRARDAGSPSWGSERNGCNVPTNADGPISTRDVIAHKKPDPLLSLSPLLPSSHPVPLSASYNHRYPIATV